jgi:hypothetical protein
MRRTFHRSDGGFTTIQYVAATGFTLVLLVVIANLLVDLYARGAVREALDEGVRAEAPVGAPAGACERRAGDALRGLLHGPVGDGVAVTCTVDGARVVANASVTLRSWLPGLVPSWHFDAVAAARLEQ